MQWHNECYSANYISCSYPMIHLSEYLGMLRKPFLKL